jgi:hypothetical protein
MMFAPARGRHAVTIEEEQHVSLTGTDGVVEGPGLAETTILLPLVADRERRALGKALD